jgi:O-antigen/teichoic acid export membrane protein
MTRLGVARRSLDPLRPRVTAWLARYRYGVAALDQIALSVFNFGLTLCLVRALSATDFGIVSLWMTVSLFAIGIQNALVNTPLSVYLPGAGDETAKKRLEAALATVNIATLAATALGVAAVNLIVDAEWTPPDTITALAVLAFVVTSLSREYCRSIAFARRDMGMLLLVDAPYLAVTTVCLVLLLAWPQRFASLSIAFLMLSLGAIVSQALLRRPRAADDPRPFGPGCLAPYRRVAGEIGWSLTGVIATHLHGRSYVYVTINLVGLAGLAAINVVGVLFRPVRTMLTAWGRSALPQLAGFYASGRVAAFDRLVWQAFVAAGAASAAWTGVLWFGWDEIARHFLVGKYPDAWLLVLPWAIAAGLQCMEYTLGVALQAAREFRFLAYTTLCTAPLTVATTAAVILWHDYTWTMYGTAFGNLVALLMEGGRLCAVRRRIVAGAPAAAGALAE